jgi:hypothetical protein
MKNRLKLGLTVVRMNDSSLVWVQFLAPSRRQKSCPSSQLPAFHIVWNLPQMILLDGFMQNSLEASLGRKMYASTNPHIRDNTSLSTSRFSSRASAPKVYTNHGPIPIPVSVAVSAFCLLFLIIIGFLVDDKNLFILFYSSSISRDKRNLNDQMLFFTRPCLTRAFLARIKGKSCHWKILLHDDIRK